MANELLKEYLYTNIDTTKWDDTIFDGMDDDAVEDVVRQYEVDAANTGEDPEIGFSLKWKGKM